MKGVSHPKNQKKIDRAGELKKCTFERGKKKRTDRKICRSGHRQGEAQPLSGCGKKAKKSFKNHHHTTVHAPKKETLRERERVGGLFPPLSLLFYSLEE
jgi:hypothetical protein